MSDEIIQIADFRRILTAVDEFVNFSNPISTVLSTMASMVRRSFQLELDFICVGVYRERPTDEVFSELTTPLSNSIAAISTYRSSNRNDAEFFNHLSTISESIAALGWISVRPAPVQFVRDMREAGEYYGNRVLSSNRGNVLHTGWVSRWNSILQSLEQYVRDHHRTGFEWGIANRVPGGAAARGRQPPPPPPPPQPPQIMKTINVAGDCGYLYTTRDPPQTTDLSGGGESGGFPGALLKEINQGVDIVRRLKPVAKSGPGGDAPLPSASATSQKLPKKPASVTEQPAKFVLDGRKWRVEYQKNVYDLVIKSDDMSQSISCFKCENMGLEVRNKMNGVTIDNSKRSTIVLNDIISSVELIRCSNVKVQCNGVVPLISMDNCDSVSIFLTERSIGAEMISSKSTSSNICLLKPDGDYTELPVPEQIKTTVVGKKLQSTVLENN